MLNFNPLPDAVFDKLYTMLDGAIEFCSGMQNTGSCSCCTPTKDTDVLYFLPGEFEYLTKHKNMQLERYMDTDLMGRCAYSEKFDCPFKPFMCRVYPLVPIKCSKYAVETLTFDSRCAAIKRLGYNKMLELGATHINRCVDAINYLLSVDPTLRFWFSF